MDTMVWRAKSQGGYVRVFCYIDGTQQPNPISVSGQKFGEQLAKALNDAHAAGVAEGLLTGRKEGRDDTADMLGSRFPEDGYGDWQDGWRAAAKEARQHPV